MRGYIVLISQEVTGKIGESIYLSDFIEDKVNRVISLKETDSMDRALLLNESEKDILENMLAYYNREGDVYFIEVDRKTEIVIDECI